MTVLFIQTRSPRTTGTKQTDQQRRVGRVDNQTRTKSRVDIYTTQLSARLFLPTLTRFITHTSPCCLFLAFQPTSSFAMAPKPASTAGKAPASTASKAPAKSSEGAKAAKKTSKPATGADGEKKKRKKVRKETYSSYIYKGELATR